MAGGRQCSWTRSRQSTPRLSRPRSTQPRKAWGVYRARSRGARRPIFVRGYPSLTRSPQTASGSGGPGRVRANSRSADDAGRIAHRRRHERGVRLEEPLVLGELPGEAAAQDDEVRPEIGLVSRQELVELTAPLLPAHLPPGARRARQTRLGVAAVELDVSQLHVWDELPVDEERRANAGPEGQQQDDAGLALAGAEGHFAHTGCISVIQYHDRAAESLLKHLLHRRPDPRAMQLGCRQCPTAPDHRREPGPARQVGGEHARRLEPADDINDDTQQCLGGGPPRRPSADPLGHELTAREIDDGRLDAGATNVDAKGPAGQALGG